MEKKAYIKPAVNERSVCNESILAASGGLMGSNGTNIGNGGTTSSGSGFSGAQVKGRVSFDW